MSLDEKEKKWSNLSFSCQGAQNSPVLLHHAKCPWSFCNYVVMIWARLSVKSFGVVHVKVIDHKPRPGSLCSYGVFFF